MGDNNSTVEGYSVLWRDLQYCGGIPSVLRGIPSVLWGCPVQWGIALVLWKVFSTVGDNISTCRGITSVLWMVFSTVEGYLQYCGGITAVHVGDSFSTVGIPSVLWRLFSTVRG